MTIIRDHIDLTELVTLAEGADFARNRSLVSVQSDQLFRSFRSPR